jgi:electron transfer flavoprotein alpha subunit
VTEEPVPRNLVALIVEHEGGVVRAVSYECGEAARQVAALMDGTVAAIVVGNDVAAGRFATETGIDTIALATPGHETCTAALYLAVLPPLLNDVGARAVCVAQTSKGWDFAPGLAVAMQGACVIGADGVTREGERLLFRRATHDGRIVAHVLSCTERTVFTVLPGAFARTADRADRAGIVTRHVTTVPPLPSRHLGSIPVPEIDRGLQAADVVVAVGRGLGNRDNIEIARRVAAAIPKAAVAGSRPVCDAGWLPYARQVGQTGAVIRPKVYLACGISGASQHIVGMKDSRFVVAVNRDPHAPIFRHADIGIAEDAPQFLAAFLREISVDE